MSNAKVVMGQAANTLVKPLEVEDVFSTYLYEGNGAARSITNGIDLDGEGGLVWIKTREAATYFNHTLYDTENGANYLLRTNGTNALTTASGFGLTSFNSDGFDMGIAYGNESGIDTASWTFRKAPKFFDVVTYTGDGVAGREIAHNLGSVPGCFILKATSTTGDWIVYHRGLSDPSNKALALHLTNAELDNTYFNDTDPTATHFVVGGQGLGINNTGVSYVAYLFAHNDGDGGFNGGDIIKCGSYTGSSSDQFIDLGFEPQWLMVKSSSFAQDWVMFDAMRGLTDTSSERLVANDTSAGANSTGFPIPISANGFSIDASHASSALNYNGQTYIYIAIRRGTKVPESATEVFAPNFYGTSGYVGYLGAPADMHMLGYRNGGSQNAIVSSRLVQGNKALVTSSTAAEITSNSSWDNMSGVTPVGTTLSTLISWTWKRAPNFFDVVAYTGDNVAGRTISHNLGVAPEMIWVKKRSEATDWNVYHSGLGPTKTIWLNQTSTGNTHPDYWYNTAPTSSVFSVGGGNPNNYTTRTYIAYLFATLAGISKVGSYTGTGSDIDIDCGFSSGARFVIFKNVTNAGSWYVFDSTRGITSSTSDPWLLLDSTSAEATSTNVDVNPLASGFTVAGYNLTIPSNEYIFYAIA